ncbi:MAG: FtsW/RodA/SpoVE family cell cycle protein, partial [Terrimesophilobacter sp.]
MVNASAAVDAKNGVSAAENPSPTSPLRLQVHIPAKLRNLELMLLLGACLINGAAVSLVQLGALGEIQTEIIWMGGGLALLALGMHVALRFLAPEADPFILPIATLLNGLGIAEIYRLDIAAKSTGWGADSIRQIVWTAIAMLIALAVIVVIRNPRVLQRYRYIAMFTGIVLLLLPMLPVIGSEKFGARLWVQFGIFSIQPGELAKIALAIFFAGYLVQARDSLSLVGKKFLGMRFPRARDLGPILVIWAAAMGVLIVQKDLGTSLLYFGLFLVMIYVATGRLSWVALGLLLFVGGALVASQVFSYVGARFHGWLDAFNPDVYDSYGGSYQLVQGLFGMAHGVIIGTGFGEGQPQIVPLAESDYIISSLGEELGL